MLLLSGAALGARATFNDHVHFCCDVGYGFGKVFGIVEERAGGEGLHPVVVPEGLENLRIKFALEEGVLELIILACMEAEVSNLISRDHSINRTTCLLLLHLLDVALRENAETCDLYLTGRHRALWINNYSNEGLLMLLIKSLRAHIDTGQPTAITWVGMVPPAHVLWAVYFVAELNVCCKVLICLISCVHTGLCSLHRETKGVHHVEGV